MLRVHNPLPATNPWITCDVCHRRFSLMGAHLGEYPASDGGVDVGMRCPYCDKLYPSAHITPRGLALRDAAWATDDLEERASLLERFAKEVTSLR